MRDSLRCPFRGQFNKKKTKFMIVRGATAPTALSTQTYDNIAKRRRSHTTTMHNQRRKVIQTCVQCGKQFQAASMRRHMQRQHGRTQRNYGCIPVHDTGTYRIPTFIRGQFNACPVANCTGGDTDRSTFYCHFCLCYPHAEIIITEEGELEKCDLCGMRCVNLRGHRGKSTCKQAAQRRYNEAMQEWQVEANGVGFIVNGKQIDRVWDFKYLGRYFTEDGDDTKCIQENVKMARQQWNSIANILKREGADPASMSRFYLTVIQAVLLYGADSWCVSERNMGILKGFHQRAIRYMTGEHIQKQSDDSWTTPDHTK